jgi:lipopolysaccharide/colanic/teichoic acid biosynthesis glycosyltransferase
MEHTFVHAKTKAFVRRLMDLIVLIVTAPVWLTAYVVLFSAMLLEQLLRWDFGPLFVHEIRLTQGKPFKLYKLSLFKESYRRKYWEIPGEMKSHTFLQKENPDSLSTVGRVMKKYCLDEAGQFLNLIIGNISTVGPRPYILAEIPEGDLPRQLLKAGMLSVNNNNIKTGQSVISKITTEDEYLDLMMNGTVWQMVRANCIIILDGIRAILMGKGM